MIGAVGAGPADAVAVVADFHQAAELLDPPGLEQIDAHPAAEDFGDAVEQDAAGMVGRRLGVGGEVHLHQPLVLGREHGAEIVAGHGFGHAEQPAIDVAGGIAELGRIDVAEILDRAGNFGAALLQQGQAEVIAGDAGVELVAGRGAFGRLDVAVGDHHLIVGRGVDHPLDAERQIADLGDLARWPR